MAAESPGNEKAVAKRVAVCNGGSCWRKRPCRSPLSGDRQPLTLPRAKALGYSVSPFHGAFRYDYVATILSGDCWIQLIRVLCVFVVKFGFNQTPGGLAAYHRFSGARAGVGFYEQRQDRSQYFARETLDKDRLASSIPKSPILQPG